MYVCVWGGSSVHLCLCVLYVCMCVHVLCALEEGGRSHTIQQYEFNHKSQRHFPRLFVVHHTKNILHTSSFSKHLTILSVSWRRKSSKITDN